MRSERWLFRHSDCAGIHPRTRRHRILGRHPTGILTTSRDWRWNLPGLSAAGRQSRVFTDALEISRGGPTGESCRVGSFATQAELPVITSERRLDREAKFPDLFEVGNGPASGQ